jgi:dihydroorotase
MTGRQGLLLAAAIAASAALSCSSAAPPAETYDLVLAGGRVMDPESGLDAVRHVGIRGKQIATISETPLAGREVLDVSGLVVAPGFIDLHVHGQDPLSWDFMARDGVTSALELEAGVHDLAKFVAEREGKARIHFGASAGHMLARGSVLSGADLTTLLNPTPAQRRALGTRWSRDAASQEELARILAALEADLDAGAIGIGMGIAYTPGASDDELRAVFALAARRRVPVFVHIASATAADDLRPIDQVIGYAEATGAALHVVHINSSGGRSVREYIAHVYAARARGVDVTTEAYPYTASSTFLQSAIFDEGFRERMGIDYGNLQWVATGERLTAETFARYRAQGGTVIAHWMKPELVRDALAHPGVMVGSDGMPMGEGNAHPRSAGTHARVLGRYVREDAAISLMDALAKMTLLPARRIEAIVPDMKRKGRLRVGADADITVFDPATVVDRATYESSHQASAGIPHVLVEGTFVVHDGELVAGAVPGRALRSAAE